jgi:hypothetical protein
MTNKIERLASMRAACAVASLFIGPIAVACPDGWSSTSFGTCLPNAGGGGNSSTSIPGIRIPNAPGLGPISLTLQHIGGEVVGFVGGVPLEIWLQNSRNLAYGSSQPIPPDVHQKLAGYVPDSVLNVARYKIGDTGFANLANVIEGNGFNGSAAAVTLIDVIIFRSINDYQRLDIWAHEMKHVEQYQGWGVHSFAVQYARNYQTVEQPAYAQGDGYAPWAAEHGIYLGTYKANGNQPMPNPGGPLPRQAIAAYCNNIQSRLTQVRQLPQQQQQAVANALLAEASSAGCTFR